MEADIMTGMGVAYDKTGSALIEESEYGIWKAGKRCPDIEISSGGSADGIRLYSTIVYGQFSIMSIGNPLKQTWPELPVTLARYTVLPPGQGGDSSIGLTFTSTDVRPGERYVAVARPDTYLGYVGSEEGAISYVSRILGRS